jgi:outer membrane receptor protein involved in Fe transport
VPHLPALSALFFAAALALLAGARPTAALAQQAEQITVTGASGSQDPTGTTFAGAQAIADSGQSTLGALLDQLPAFGSQGVNAAQTDGGFGEYFIDLRNLNFDRTLVLVDGSRFVLSGIQTDEAVDLNDIPTAFVDRVEVLKDGTQPQYGPDAVAGAVNVVLKDQMNGLRLETYGAATGVPDGGTADISLVGGHGFTKGHVTFGIDFYQRDPVLQSSRAWAADPIASAIATPSGDEILYGSPATPGGHAVATGISAEALGNGQTTPYSPLNAYNPSPNHDLQGGLQRESAYFDGDYALTDSISANTELLFTDRRATTLQSPQTLGLTGTAKNPNGFTIPGTNPFNPFGVPVTLERVVTEAGPQATTTTGPVWRALAGLDGVLNDWTWSASFDRGQSLSTYVTGNEINLTRALQTAGNGACPAASGCVEANWFGPDSLSQQALGYITYTARSQSAYTETVGQGRLTGPVFTAPGGAAKLTIGADLRAESATTTVPPVTQQGNQAGNDAKPSSGGYDSYEAYTALSLPLLENAFLAHRLSVLLEARFTGTSRYGAFPTLRASMDYAPVDGLHLRATSGTARRPPAISEAFLGITGSQQPVSDPCGKSAGLRANPVVNANCLAQGLGPNFTQASPLIDVLSGGNPSLHPEQSENETLGLTLSPPAARWLSASVDYYQYRITSAIDSLADTDPNLIPDICYATANLASPLCRLITRIGGGGNAGQISSILALDENVGTIKENGLDFELSADLPAIRFGALKLGWQTNWLLNYRLHTDGQPGFVQYAGTFPGLNEVGSYARVRSRATAEWAYGSWSFGWTGRFISGARVLGDTAADLFSKAPGILYHDFDLTRHFGRLTAMAGIDNLADKHPPTLVDGETNTDTSTYDVLGRVFWGRLAYDF